jgi:hypothetical protein
MTWARLDPNTRAAIIAAYAFSNDRLLAEVAQDVIARKLRRG